MSKVMARRSTRPFTAAVMLVVVVGAAACGSGAATKPGNPSSGAALAGRLTVFAAASLTESLNQEKQSLRRRHPKLSVTYSFAGSQLLAQQILQGAPADVFASADEKNMQKLVDARLVEKPLVFARNKLEIAVARGNPKHVTGLRDLGRSDLTVVLADPSVPAGNYSRQALDAAGVTAHPKSLELDVRAALAKVASGEADATVVYVSDIRGAGAKVDGVEIPDAQNVIARYVAAVVRRTGNAAVARAFLADLVSGDGHAAIVAHGLLPAE